jgi:hypothetical protein
VTRVRAGGRRTDRHHRLAPLLLVATVIVVAWGIVATLHLVRADQRLRSGIDAAQGVRQELSSTDIAAGTASPQLTAAAHDFADAHADIDSDWLEPLHIVPIVRTQVRSVDALSGAAAGITSAGTTTLATAHAILDAPHDTPAERTDDILRLAATVATLEERVAGVSLGPDHQLIGTLAAKRDVFAQDLTTLLSPGRHQQRRDALGRRHDAPGRDGDGPQRQTDARRLRTDLGPGGEIIVGQADG